jgi:hypothetical protein
MLEAQRPYVGHPTNSVYVDKHITGDIIATSQMGGAAAAAAKRSQVKTKVWRAYALL